MIQKQTFKETEIGMIPKDWKILTLEEATEEIIDYRGKTPKKTTSGVPLITAKIVKNGHILEPDEFISESDYEDWMRRGMPQCGDVIITTEAPMGEVAQLDDRKVALAQRLITLRGKKDLLNNNFLRFVLQSSILQNELRKRESGTTVTGIKQSELRKVLLPIPPYPEQKAISDVLLSIDDKIALNHSMNSTLEAIGQALFKHWFIDFEFPNEKGKPYRSSGGEMVETELGEVPKGWRVVALGDILKLQRGHDLPAKDRNEGEVPVVASSGITGKHNSAQAKPPGIAMGRTGTLGNVFFFDEPFWPLNTTLYVKKLYKGTWMWAFHLLKSLSLVEYRVGSTVPTLNRNHLHLAPILLPPQDILMIFDKIETSLHYMIATNEKQSCTLIAIRDALLPKLMSGEVRVNAEQNSQTI